MTDSDSSDGYPGRTYRAHCDDCAIQTEKRHTLQSARELCEMHNEAREGCEAEPIPVCWVCFNRATHCDQTPPHEYVCEDHAISIDAVPVVTDDD